MKRFIIASYKSSANEQQNRHIGRGTLIRVFPYFASYNGGADENLIQGFMRYLKSSVSR